MSVDLEDMREVIVSLRNQISAEKVSTENTEDDKFWSHVEGSADRNRLDSDVCRRLWDYFYYDNYNELTARHRTGILQLERDRKSFTDKVNGEVNSAKNEANINIKAIESAHRDKISQIESEGASKIEEIDQANIFSILMLVVAIVGGIFSKENDILPYIFGFIGLISLGRFAANSGKKDEVRKDKEGKIRAANNAKESESREINLKLSSLISKKEGELSAYIDNINRKISGIENDRNFIISKIPSRPSDKDVDTWINEFKDLMIIEINRRTGIDNEDDLVHEPVVLWAPAAYQEVADDVSGRLSRLRAIKDDRIDRFVISEKDNRPRFSVEYAKIIIPAKEFIAVYSSFVDIIEREIYGEIIDQYFYNDIVSVATEATDRRLGGEPETANFKISLSSGYDTSIQFEDKGVRNRLLREKEKSINEQRDELIQQMQSIVEDYESADVNNAEKSILILKEEFFAHLEHIKMLPKIEIMEKIPLGIADSTVSALRSTIQDRKSVKDENKIM